MDKIAFRESSYQKPEIDMVISAVVSITLVLIIIIILFPAAIYDAKKLEAMRGSRLKGRKSQISRAKQLEFWGQNSYYKKYTGQNKGKIVAILHYVDWCNACDRAMAHWQEIKAELAQGDFAGITLIENDEAKKPTPGIWQYPTIIRFYKGRIERFNGPMSRLSIKRFILNARHYNF